MKRTILTYALAAVGLVAAAGVADAQVRVPVQSYYFNPWGGYPNYSVATYGSYGGMATRSYAMDPWTGTSLYQNNFYNPYSGVRGSYTYGYNPWVNQYQYQYNYNYGFPYTYNTFPRTAWQYGYWR